MTNLAVTPGPSQFSIGRSLSDSLGVMRRNLKVVAVIALAVTAVESAARYLLTGTIEGEENGAGFLSVVFYALVTAPITYIAFQDLRGHRPSLGETLSAGLQRVIRVVGATLVVGIAIVVPVGIVFLFVFLNAGGAIWVLIVGGGIYALFIFLLWYVVVPVQVVETVSFLGGFGRASDLTYGRRWAVLGLILVFLALVIIIAIVVGLAAEVMAAINPFLSLLLIIPLNAFITVYGATVPTVTYCLLRQEKEGIGIEDIVQVFD